MAGKTALFDANGRGESRFFGIYRCIRHGTSSFWLNDFSYMIRSSIEEKKFFFFFTLSDR